MRGSPDEPDVALIVTESIQNAKLHFESAPLPLRVTEASVKLYVSLSENIT